MRKFFLVLSLIASSLALAVPAKPIKRIITLADGTQKSTILRGDEYGHYYVDDDGVFYTKSGDVFVVADKDALLKRRSEKLALNNERRMKRAKQWGLIREDGSFGWQHKENEIAAGRNKAKWGAFTNPISGKKKGLVILANFADKSMKAAHSQSFFNDFFNKEGFSLENMYGSVHDYFMECSYGQFDLSFDVIGPVTVSKNYAYYGENDSNGDDKYPAVLVTEACKLADKLGVDFSQYDWDGDGEVEQVFVLFAGCGEAASYNDDAIWPHEHSLTGEKAFGDGNGAIMLDGVKVDTYAVSCELAGSGSMVDGIGTACHEFSHCMCLPDLYDTSSGTSSGLEYWDLMDSGSYAGPYNHGECPTAYTSYERMYCGWLKPVELSAPMVVSDMKDIVTSSEAYIIYNQRNRNEFYLLENRQKVGFNKYNVNHGLLIFHVDFDASSWADNKVNSSKSHPRLMIVPADNSLSSYNDTGDTWPGKTGNTAFTDTSVPAATLFNYNVDGRKFLGKPIENISESSAGTISFLFDGGFKLDAPTAYEAQNVTPYGFTATWSEVDGATMYELEVAPHSVIEGGLLCEDFSGFNNGLLVDGIADVSDRLDGYTTVPGWSGEKLFLTSDDEVKLGTSKMNGEITTPMVHVTENMLTLYLSARQYKQDEVKLVVKINGDEVASITNPQGSDLYRFTASVQGDVKVTVSTVGGRVYLSQLVVYDGDYDIKDTDEFEINNDLIASCFTVDGQTYEFTALNPSYDYSYRVRACAGEFQSEWSNSVNVKLLKETDNVNVAKISAKSKDVEILDLMGRIVRGNAKPGIYVVDGKKMWIK